MFKPKQRTFKQTVVRALIVPVFVTGVFGSFLVAGSLLSQITVAQQQGATTQLERPTAEGSPQWLIEKNDCWTSKAPANMRGVVPGHVVVRVDGGDAFLGGDRMVGQALEQIFEDADHGLTIYGFCR